jgi:hypothetical protein
MSEKATALELHKTPPPVMEFESTALDFYSSYGKEEKGQVIRLLQGKHTPLADKIGEVIAVQHLVAHRIEVADEDGEVQLLDRIVLVDADGQAYQCVSDGIRRSLRYFAHFYGSPPWSPALKVKVEQITTRRGFRTFSLTPVA